MGMIQQIINDAKTMKNATSRHPQKGGEGLLLGELCERPGGSPRGETWALTRQRAHLTQSVSERFLITECVRLHTAEMLQVSNISCCGPLRHFGPRGSAQM